MPGVAVRRLVLLSVSPVRLSLLCQTFVGFHNLSNQFVAYNVFLFSSMKLIPFTPFRMRSACTSPEVCDWEGRFASYPPLQSFGIHAHTGEEHLYLLGGGVLRFIQNHYGIVQRASAHESEGSNLNDVQLHVLFQFGGGNHVLQGVVKRLQVRVYLVLHVAGQETEFLSGLYGGTAEDYFFISLFFNARTARAMAV